MKKIALLSILSVIIILSGCDDSYNFMDVDNPNAKDNLKSLIGVDDIPKINAEDIVPDSLSGTWEDAKGYVNKYYEDTMQPYVDKAKEGISGAKETLKGYYNSGVDELNGIINEKVNGLISGELSKFKIK